MSVITGCTDKFEKINETQVAIRVKEREINKQKELCERLGDNTCSTVRELESEMKHLRKDKEKAKRDFFVCGLSNMFK